MKIPPSKEEQLKKRINDSKAKRNPLTKASTFVSMSEATEIAKKALYNNKARIDAWLKDPRAPARIEPVVTEPFDGGLLIVERIDRNGNRHFKRVKPTKVVMVLEKVRRSDGTFAMHIVTMYPAT